MWNCCKITPARCWLSSSLCWIYFLKWRIYNLGNLDCISRCENTSALRPNFEPCHGLKAIEGFGLKAMLEAEEDWLVGRLQPPVLLVQTEAANFLLTVERVRWNPPGRFFRIAWNLSKKSHKGKSVQFSVGIIYWFLLDNSHNDIFDPLPTQSVDPPINSEGCWS